MRARDPARRTVPAGALAAPALIAARGQRVDPTWSSLVENYRYPDWFRDAKFGVWSPALPAGQSDGRFPSRSPTDTFVPVVKIEGAGLT